MNNVKSDTFDMLKERGYIEQTTDEGKIRELLGKESVTFYTGFDPTADSLTAGGFMCMMSIAHMQRAGHRPIILFGGGTGMVGDPTDKSDMRKMLTQEEITHNISKFKEQFSRIIDFSDGKAIVANNADWLLALQYVPFIREYGVHFTVNRMMAADCYKTRFERGDGLTFFEFNYMIMQAYDFLELNRRYNCVMQFGGNDQWSNIIAGVELIRRYSRKEVYAMTCPLLTKHDGEKMGKTASGAVWLDKDKTSPYDFYQYWRNVDDADVIRFLKVLTFMPLEEIDELSKLTGGDVNKAKDILAYEVTKTVHGEEEADKARSSARSLFGGGGDGGGVPTFALTKGERLVNILDLLVRSGLAPSKSEARRNVEQGGVTADGIVISDIKADISNFPVLLRRGKKSYIRVVAE